jgi:hypothetical protein
MVRDEEGEAICAVELLTLGELTLLGPASARARLLIERLCFGRLFSAIDGADRAFRGRQDEISR